MNELQFDFTPMIITSADEKFFLGVLEDSFGCLTYALSDPDFTRLWIEDFTDSVYQAVNDCMTREERLFMARKEFRRRYMR